MSKDIENLNTLFSPFGLKVDEVINGAQSIKYKINLPLDLNIQGKIKKAESTIKYAIPRAIGTTEFIYGHDDHSIYIEKKSDKFDVVKFENLIPGLPQKGLYLLLGKDDNGNPTYTNLRKAPHILVAGTTGSGKSELLHTFLASLIYRRKDNPCQIIIIDPKRSEFSMYKNKNALYLVTEMSEAVDKLKQCCDIMDDRYKMIEAKQCKDIEQLNDPSILPIVIVIDELRDLLMQDKRAEQYIIRLAQKARACGIHLILGTQTPRADVVTGGIKANVPTKIALHTTSALESRIILGENGAEKLFGNGDMLYLGNGKLSLIRMQAAYISNDLKSQLADCIPESNNRPQQQAQTKKFDYYSYYESQGYDLRGAMERYRESVQNKAPANPPQPTRKKVGLFQGLKNLWNAPQTTTTSDMLAMRTSRRSR